MSVHFPTRAHPIPRLATLQIISLALIGFVSVISSPRQMLLEVLDQPNIPLDFRIVALSLPDFVVVVLLAVTVIRLLADSVYRERLLDTLGTVLLRLGGIFWALLAGWMALGMLWAGSAVMVRYSTLHLLCVLATALVLADLVRADEAPGGRAILYGLLAGACVQSVLAVLQVINNGPLGLWALGEISRFWYAPTNFYRAPGLSMHPNYLGGYQMIGLFASILLGVQFRREGRSLALPALAGVASAIGLIATLSRSALVGTGVGLLPLVLGVFVRVRGRARIVFMLGGTAALILAGIWLLIALRSDIQTRIFAPREFFFDDSWAVIQGAPVLGVGAGNLMLEVGRMRADSSPNLLPVHNVYLYVWGEVGLPGVILFVAACGAILVRLRPRFGRDSRLWTLCLLAVCVVMLFDNYFWAVHPFRVLFFWVIGMGWGLAMYQPPPGALARPVQEPVRLAESSSASILDTTRDKAA
jgi:O-antigen ligase